MRRLSSYLTGLFVAMFMLGIALGLLGQLLSVNDNKDYENTLEEINTVEEIEEAWLDEDSGNIFVCYSTGSYVNVYDIDGNFKYAVSIPYHSHGSPHFAVYDGKLYICHYETYIYNASDGKFIDKMDEEAIYDIVDTENITEYDGIEYGFYSVVKTNSDGSRQVIFEKTKFCLLLNFGFCWSVSFTGGIGLLILSMATKIRRRKQFSEPPKSKKAKIVAIYMAVTSFVQALFAIINIVLSVFGIPAMIGLVPIAIHFIISSIVIYNISDRGFVDQGDVATVEMWKAIEMATIAADFISIIISVLLIQ